MNARTLRANGNPGPARLYRGSSGEARRLERREKFLDAARQVFGTRGFHGATVRSICEEAALTERYFYESFDNSEALFIAMHRRTSDHIIAEITEASESTPGTQLDKLRALLTAYYADIRRDPLSARLFSIDAGYISPAAKEVCASWRGAFGLVLARTLDVQRDMDSATLRSGVVRALLGMGVDWMENGFSAPIDEIVEAGMKIVPALRG